MRYALRQGDVLRPLSVGRIQLGRAETCDISLDDPLVSRLHAALEVNGESLIVEDLGSRNGVRVNGERIEAPRVLRAGDVLRIGSAEFTIVREERPPEASAGVATTQTVIRHSTTQRIGPFGVLAALADKALALGHGEEAERILGKLLEELLPKARTTRPPGNEESSPSKANGAPSGPQRGDGVTALDESVFQQAGRYALRLAVVTGKGRWLDYLFRLYASQRRLMSAGLIEELYEAARKVQGTSPAHLEAYLAVLRSAPAIRSPSERFLMGRLEGVLALLR